MTSPFCRYCHKPVEWYPTPAGRPMPVDPGENPNGNLVIVDGKAVVVGPEVPVTGRRMTHWADPDCTAIRTGQKRGPLPARPPRGKDTFSQAAADAMTNGQHRDKLQAVFDMITVHRPISCDRIDKMTGWGTPTISARINDLANAGRIRRVGKELTRRNRYAATWEPVEGAADHSGRLFD